MYTKDEFHDLHVKKALNALQFLEELGGPEKAEGYVLVLREVIRELESRIEVAKENIGKYP